jgi:peptide/nickel transport system substrate-binding protein
MMLAALAFLPASCRKQNEGVVKVLVIGAAPKIRDPALGPLSPSDKMLLANTAQGLVRFDAAGNIVGGLAERWTVSPDGLSYIFRLQSGKWPDGRKIDANQIVRLLKREIGSSSRNSLKDRFGAVEDIVAMTDRVIEISLIAPRADLLALLAQPEMAIIRDGQGTGPFRPTPQKQGAISLSRQVVAPDDDNDSATRDQLLLAAAAAPDAVRSFAAGDVDLVLGGTFNDLPVVRGANLRRDALRFDPASGLFGLVPLAASGPLASAEMRRLFSQAIDRDALIAALGVPGLAPRATVLEPGLDGEPAPVPPPWLSTPFAERVAPLRAQAARLAGKALSRPIKVALPEGTGADLLLSVLQRSWGALGFSVERATSNGSADFRLVDEVAPTSGPSWFVRYFRCDAARVCDPAADALMDSARDSPVPAQRYALLGQAAARIDNDQLFIPITAPVRWSLVSPRIQNFAGNRYARHTLTDLQDKPGGE